MGARLLRRGTRADLYGFVYSRFERRLFPRALRKARH